MLSFLLTAVFLPAYALNVAVKTAVKLPFIPMLWVMKIFYPNIIDDINTKKSAFTRSVKETADSSFMTLSSLIAK